MRSPLLASLRVPLLSGVICLAVGLAGFAAGLSAAAGALALDGKSLLDAPPERAQLSLVLGPLLGLLPVSCLALAAARYPAIARLAPTALGLWLAAALLATYVFGIRPLLR